jgi:hypothetical protein|nr:MAG TPA: hypothetical protein [Myoviridae sp. ctfuG5]
MISLNKLDTVLDGIMPDRRKELILESFRQLEVIYGASLEGKVDDLISMTTNQDTFTFLGQVNDITITYLVDAIQTFGITIDERYSTHDQLEAIKNVLYSLLQFDEYDDPEALLTIFTGEGVDANEKAAEALALLTDLPVEEYLQLFSRVNDDLILKIVSLLEGQLRDQTDELHNEDDEFSFTASPALQQFISDKTYQRIDKALLEILGKQPGKLSLSSILRLYGNQIADQHSPEAWCFAVWVSHDGTFEMLFGLWEKHFLEEKELIEMREQVERLAKRYQGEEA